MYIWHKYSSESVFCQPEPWQEYGDSDVTILIELGLNHPFVTIRDHDI